MLIQYSKYSRTVGVTMTRVYRKLVSPLYLHSLRATGKRANATVKNKNGVHCFAPPPPPPPPPQPLTPNATADARHQTTHTRLKNNAPSIQYAYLDKVVGEGDARRSVEDGAVRVGQEVGGHHGLLRVAQHSRHRPFRRLGKHQKTHGSVCPQEPGANERKLCVFCCLAREHVGCTCDRQHTLAARRARVRST